MQRGVVGLRASAWLAASSLFASAELSCNDRGPFGSRSEDTRAAATATHLAAAPVALTPGSPATGSAGTASAACADAECPPAEDPSVERFVVIGDYGLSGPEEAQVAWRVASLKPDFIVTTGDNNYPLGAADTIDENIGRYFSAFIAPYHGKFGPGAEENRFFPCLGNHDWDSANAAPYLDYFSLPNNERYYDVVRGSVHLLALDSDANEPDGIDVTSTQAHWLEAKLEASSALEARVLPPSTLLLWPARFQHRHALALRRMGREHRVLRPRPHLRALQRGRFSVHRQRRGRSRLV